MQYKNSAGDHSAQSETSWRKQGRKLKPDAIPSGKKSARRIGTWDVYEYSQTEPIQKHTQKPPQIVDILNALWCLNRYAKRMREKASACYNAGVHGFAGDARERKEEAYQLKSQVLAHLLKDGIVQIQGYHRFDSFFAYILAGGGYTFHQPCPPPENPETVEYKTNIEAKPKDKTEGRLKDAYYTIKQYLEGRPKLPVYSWPARERSTLIKDWEDDDDYYWDGNEEVKHDPVIEGHF